MSDKRDKDDDRFTEAPKILIGEDVVHDPKGEAAADFDSKIRSAETKQTKDFIDELRRKWRR
jgi:hypothetical protein